MYCHGGAGGAVKIEVLAVDLVVTGKVIHVHEVSCNFHYIFQRGVGAGEDVAHVLDHGASLFANVEARGAERVGFGAGDRIVGPPRAGSRAPPSTASARIGPPNRP